MPHSSHQVGVPGHCVPHDTDTGVLICNSSRGEEIRVLRPPPGAPSRSTRGGFGFFRWLESGVGKAGLWPSFSGQSNAHGTERLEQSLQEEGRSSYVCHEGVPARDRAVPFFCHSSALWGSDVSGRKGWRYSPKLVEAGFSEWILRTSPVRSSWIRSAQGPVTIVSTIA